MKRLIGVLVLLALISAAIFGLASLEIASLSGTENKAPQNSIEKRVQDSQGSMLLGPGADALKSISKRYQDISVKSVPSVVYIRAVQGEPQQSVILQSEAVADYYSQVGIDVENEGTGVFINDQGLILTPLHVVLCAVAIQVRTWDGKLYQAELVSADVGTDLAILKIPSSGTRAIKWGDSSNIGLGEFLVLAGADSQMNGRICQGVVSSSGRMPQVLDEGYFGQYFLIDASSASPASGWLVLNLNGEVVGILGQSTARIYKSQGECVAFGANQVRQVADLLAQGSSIQRSYVGLNLQQLTSDLAAARHLKTTAGALVSDVVPGGPAEKAGLVPGDVVLKVASTPISQYGQVRSVVADLPSDRPVSFLIDRQGVAQTVVVTPARHPMQVIATRNENPPTRGSGTASGSALDGIGVEELPDLPGVPKTGTQPKRVAITSIDYLQVIPSMPLEAGMLVLEVDGQTIASRADFEACKEKKQEQSVVSLRIDTMGKKRYLTLRAVQ